MVQINQELKPTHPDGWHFWDGDVRLQANSYRELIVKVTEYRISQRRDWQTVVEEVNDYIVSISPTTRGPDIPPHQKTPRSLADKVYNWLSRTYDKVKSSTRYASAPVAMQRTSICTQCPYNMMTESSCGSCISQMARMAKGIAKNRQVAGDKQLRVCGLHHYDLKTAIHLEDDTLGEPTPMAEMPNYCWRQPK